jgi:uroporphyrinogen-III synthase
MHTLQGVRILITRPLAQARATAEALSERGAIAVVCPTIRIDPPSDPRAVATALGRLADYNWLVVTSANGAEALVNALSGRSTPESLRVAAIGPSTAAALEHAAIPVDVVPERYVAEALLESLAAGGRCDGLRVLIARAEVGRDTLPDGLRAAAAEVDVVAMYRTVPAEENRALLRGLLEERRIDLAICTSSSSARNLALLAGEELVAGLPVACIGPITAESARSYGMEIVAEPAVHTAEGLIAAIEEWHGVRQ